MCQAASRNGTRAPRVCRLSMGIRRLPRVFPRRERESGKGGLGGTRTSASAPGGGNDLVGHDDDDGRVVGGADLDQRRFADKRPAFLNCAARTSEPATRTRWNGPGGPWKSLASSSRERWSRFHRTRDHCFSVWLLGPDASGSCRILDVLEVSGLTEHRVFTHFSLKVLHSWTTAVFVSNQVFQKETHVKVQIFKGLLNDFD